MNKQANSQTNKQALMQNIIQHLQQELSALKTAANNAHLAAIDDQSIAETQYDTLAIEAGYLAEGQSRRVLELKKSLQQLNQLASQLTNLSFTENTPITLGALIQIEQNRNGTSQQQWLFLAPAAAGYKTSLKAEHGYEEITVITESSPMGKALMHQYLGDNIQLQQGSSSLQVEIVQLC